MHPNSGVCRLREIVRIKTLSRPGRGTPDLKRTGVLAGVFKRILRRTKICFVGVA